MTPNVNAPLIKDNNNNSLRSSGFDGCTFQKQQEMKQIKIKQTSGKELFAEVAKKRKNGRVKGANLGG